MALKNFFTGKSGVKFWVNIIIMVAVIVAIPLVALYMLDSFTHHGEKIEVPNVVGKSVFDAESMLHDRGLTAMVIDSVYEKNAPRGSVLTIPRDRALTLVIGGGEIDSTMFEDEFDGEGLDIDMDETDGEDFDIEL